MKSIFKLYFLNAISLILSLRANSLIIGHVSPEIYAQYGIYLWQVNLLASIYFAAYPQLIAVFYKKNLKNKNTKNILIAGLNLNLIVYFITIFLILVSAIVGTLPSGKNLILGLLTISGLTFALEIGISQALMQMKNQFFSYGIIGLIRPIFLLLFSSIFNRFVFGINYIYIVITFTSLTSTIIITYILIKTIPYRIDFRIKNYKPVLNFILPLIPHNILGFLSLNIDKFFITKYLDYSSVGKYLVLYYYASLLLIALELSYKVYQRWLYSKLGSEKPPNKLIAKCMLKIAIFALILTMALIPAFEIIMNIVLPTNYLSIIPVGKYFIVGIFFNLIYYLFAGFLFYFKKTRIVLLVTICSFSASIFSIIILNKIYTPAPILFGISYLIGQIIYSVLAIFSYYFLILKPSNIKKFI